MSEYKFKILWNYVFLLTTIISYLYKHIHYNNIDIFRYVGGRVLLERERRKPYTKENVVQLITIFRGGGGGEGKIL